MYMCRFIRVRNNIVPYELEYIAIMNILKPGQVIASMDDLYLSFKT